MLAKVRSQNVDRREFLSFTAAAIASVAARVDLAHTTTAPSSAPMRPLRGVTLAGGEFGAGSPEFSNQSPGICNWHYTYNSERTIEWFASRSFGLFRVPFRWERIQPRLGEELDGEELNRLREVARWAANHGAQIIPNVHNFCRYVMRRDEERIEAIIDESIDGAAPAVTRNHFADLWRRLSSAFKDDPAIYGFGLMNEPHDLGSSDWKLISQGAVDAIRSGGDKRLLLVCGADWASAGRFADANGTWAWINDPANNTAYEAHCYFDEHASGFYEASYDQELARDPGLEFRGVRRLIQFAGWCATNGVRGFIGEYGVPDDDPRWLAALRHFLDAMDKANIPGCCWAAGEWWPTDYRLSVQPRDDFAREAPQVKVIRS